MTAPGGVDDGAYDAIAEVQAGAVANRQLRALGLTEKEVKVLVRRRVLRATPARGVYRVAGAERTAKQDLWVALLAGPRGTLASHLSAAALRGLLAPPAIPHVSVPRWASGKFGGAIVHHAQVGAADRDRCEGIEATAVGRTIVDCAAVLGQPALNSLVDGAFGKGLCSYRRVMDAWRRAGRVRGGAVLEAALAPYSAGATPGSVKAAHVRDEYHGPRRWGVDDRTQAQIEALGYRVERADRFDLRPSSTRLYDRLSSVLLRPPIGPWPNRLPPGTPRAA